MVKELSPHIKDLITAYEAMPVTKRRRQIIEMLREAYLYASSDELAIVHVDSPTGPVIGAQVAYKHEAGNTSPAHITDVQGDAVTLTVHTLDGDLEEVISLNQAKSEKSAKARNWFYPSKIKA